MPKLSEAPQHLARSAAVRVGELPHLERAGEYVGLDEDRPFGTQRHVPADRQHVRRQQRVRALAEGAC